MNIATHTGTTLARRNRIANPFTRMEVLAEGHGVTLLVGPRRTHALDENLDYVGWFTTDAPSSALENGKVKRDRLVLANGHGWMDADKVAVIGALLDSVTEEVEETVAA